MSLCGYILNFLFQSFLKIWKLIFNSNQECHLKLVGWWDQTRPDQITSLVSLLERGRLEVADKYNILDCVNVPHNSPSHFTAEIRNIFNCRQNVGEVIRPTLLLILPPGKAGLSSIFLSPLLSSDYILRESSAPPAEVGSFPAGLFGQTKPKSPSGIK